MKFDFPLYTEIHTPKETNNEIKANGKIFSVVSNIDIEESLFPNVESKIPYKQFLTSLSCMNTLVRGNATHFKNQQQHLSRGVLRKKCSEDMEQITGEHPC